MYFNELDDDMIDDSLPTTKSDAPNLLEVVVLDGKEMGDGKNIEAFVVIQVGDLRKETRVSYAFLLMLYFYSRFYFHEISVFFV